MSDRWKVFDNFIDDMGSSFIEGFELDRINNDGDYDRDNCRWVSKSDNQKNCRFRSPEYLRGIARLGGLARKTKYSKEQLSAMGKKGGRPKKKKPAPK